MLQSRLVCFQQTGRRSALPFPSMVCGAQCVLFCSSRILQLWATRALNPPVHRYPPANQQPGVEALSS